MIAYYLDLARRSFRRNVGLTILMVLAIAFGVGASMTTLTVLHVLSVDPIPQKSHVLYRVQLEPRPLPGYRPGEEPPQQLTRADGEALWRENRADRRALMASGRAAIEPDRTGMQPFFVDSRWTSTDFFPMFDVPFVAGAPWSADDDARATHVVVIGRALAEKLFGTAMVAGRTVRVAGFDMRIVGVTDTWRPVPHFFDLDNGPFTQGEELFMPFSTSRELKLDHGGMTDCYQTADDQDALGAPCVWVQFWVELDSDAKLAAYDDFLVHYSNDQRAAGRFGRPTNVRLRDVIEWLAYNHVVPDDARLQSWIALGFLLVCLVNTVGLLLTKFLRRSGEIGVRRALGASRRSIFMQLLVESGAIGIAGGVLGLGLAWLGLWAVRQQPAGYADLAQLDPRMLALTLGLAVGSSLLAGVLPAWRGCQVPPALQLKSN